MKQYYCIAITFMFENEIKYFRFGNCTAAVVREIRETLIREGLQVPGDTLRDFIVILPWFVRSITVTAQEKYWNYEHSTTKQTIFDDDGKKV
jgi:hypothetical protein